MCQVITVKGKKVELTVGPYWTQWTPTLRWEWKVIDAEGNWVRKPPANGRHEALMFQTGDQAFAFAMEMNRRVGINREDIVFEEKVVQLAQ